MTEQIFNQTKTAAAKDVFAYRQNDRDPAGNGWTKYHTGATVGMIGAIVVFLSAVFTTIFEFFAGEKSHTLWLFLTVFALFALGSHCLDKIGDLKHKDRGISYENDEQNS